MIGQFAQGKHISAEAPAWQVKQYAETVQLFKLIEPGVCVGANIS